MDDLEAAKFMLGMEICARRQSCCRTQKKFEGFSTAGSRQQLERFRGGSEALAFGHCGCDQSLIFSSLGCMVHLKDLVNFRPRYAVGVNKK